MAAVRVELPRQFHWCLMGSQKWPQLLCYRGSSTSQEILESKLCFYIKKCIKLSPAHLLLQSGSQNRRICYPDSTELRVGRVWGPSATLVLCPGPCLWGQSSGAPGGDSSWHGRPRPSSACPTAEPLSVLREGPCAEPRSEYLEESKSCSSDKSCNTCPGRVRSSLGLSRASGRPSPPAESLGDTRARAHSRAR